MVNLEPTNDLAPNVRLHSSVAPVSQCSLHGFEYY